MRLGHCFRLRELTRREIFNKDFPHSQLRPVDHLHLQAVSALGLAVQFWSSGRWQAVSLETLSTVKKTASVQAAIQAVRTRLKVMQKVKWQQNLHGGWSVGR